MSWVRAGSDREGLVGGARVAWAVALVVLGLAVHLLWVGAPLGPIEGFLAWLVFACLAVAGWVHHEFGRSDGGLPFLTLGLLRCYGTYAAPVLWFTESLVGSAGRRLTAEDARAGLLVANLFVVAILAAYGLAQGTATRALGAWVRRWMAVPAGTERLGLVFVGLTLAACGVHFVGESHRLDPTAAGVVGVPYLLAVTMQPLVFFGICTHLFLQGGESRLGRVPYAVALLAMVALGLYSGLIERILQPVAILAVCTYHHRGRIPWKAAAVAVTVFVIVNPIKHVYRAAVGEEGGDLAASVTAWESAWETKPKTDEAGSTARLNELALLADAVRRIPDEVPYRYGYPWRVLALAWVPRAFWPDKPDLRRVYMTEWAVQMGYMSPKSHEHGAANLPLPVDGYWNLGWIGVVLVGLLAGLILAASRHISNGGGPVGFGVGVALLVGNHITMAVGSCVMGFLGTVAAGVFAATLVRILNWVLVGAGTRHARV